MTAVLEASSAATAVAGTKRWWALGALVLAALAVGVDGTVLSVALPTLSKALHASESDLQWFSSGYFLVLAAAMLPAGLLGDRYGRKKVLVASLALFGAGSVACAYSTSVAEFMAARVLVGLAGAGLIVMAFSAVTVLFAKHERPKAVGLMSGATFLAFPIGPILGGWLLTNYWWGWVFLINVPVIALGLAAVVALLPESREAQRPSLDLTGVAASAAGLVAVTYGLIKAGQDGWGNLGALALMAAGLVLLVGFFAWERRLTRQPGGQPLVDLGLFALPSFTWGVVLAVVPILALLGISVHHAPVLPRCARHQCHGLGTAPLAPCRRAHNRGCPGGPDGPTGGGQGGRRRRLRLVGRRPVPRGPDQRRSERPVRSVVDGGGRDGDRYRHGHGHVGRTGGTVGGKKRRRCRRAAGREQDRGPFGIAVLGSVLSAGYLGRLDLSGLSATAAAAVRQSVFGGVAVAHEIRSASLLRSVDTAFVHGMDQALLVSAGIAVVGLVLTVVFLPKVNAPAEQTMKPGPPDLSEVVSPRPATIGAAA